MYTDEPCISAKKATAYEQAIYLWRPKQVARERARELLSRDFSRLPQRIAYLQAEKLESTQNEHLFFFLRSMTNVFT